MSTNLNLLPPQRRMLLERRRIISLANRLLRTIILLLLLVSGVGLAGIITLGYLERQESLSADANLAKAIAAYSQLRQAVAQKNTLLDTIDTVSNAQIIWNEKISDILTTIPSGVRILSMQGHKEDESYILFSGQSPTRNSLILLEKRLEALPWAGILDAPNSNLIDRVQAPYEFRVTIK